MSAAGITQTKPHLKTATPDDVKILLTNATGMSVTEVIELDSLRWQIELFFQEWKSTLGFHQYRFQDFAAVRAWAEIALATVLFLEYERAKHLTDRVSPDARRWWQSQRLHGLCAALRPLCSALRQESAGRERKYLADRLKSASGIPKLKRLLAAALPKEYRTPA